MFPPGRGKLASRPVQLWVFHQAENGLTTLPVLRYRFNHRNRKCRLKNLSIAREVSPSPNSDEFRWERACFFLPLPFRCQRAGVRTKPKAVKRSRYYAEKGVLMANLNLERAKTA